MAGSVSPALVLWCIAAGIAGLAVGRRTPELSLSLIKYKEGKKGMAYQSYLFPEWRNWLYGVSLAAIWVVAVCWYNPVQIIVLGGLSTVALMIIYMDNRYRIIANEITFPLMVCGLILNLVSGGIRGLAGSLAAAGIGLMLFVITSVITRKKGAVGAGDVKLMMAAAFVCGYPGIMYLLMFMAAAMGSYCAAGLFTRRLSLVSYFPMGGFIAAGMIFAFVEEQIMPWISLLLQRIF